MKKSQGSRKPAKKSQDKPPKKTARKRSVDDSADWERFPIVGIGASAGGLSALKQFFAHVPEDTGLAYVVVVHLSPEHESHMAELLQPHVRMPVQQVNESVELLPNRVFVIPPKCNLDTIDTHLRPTDLETRRQERAPVDHFFRTLAKTHEGDAIGVVLTGTGSDGTLGLREIKERGGLCVAQDPHDAEYDGMPQSAISTGIVDYVLPVARIPSAIQAYVRTQPRVPVPEDEEQIHDELLVQLQKVFGQIRARTGRDFSRYKRSTILRRIYRRMQLNQIEQIADYTGLLRKSPKEVQQLSEDLLITVTNFFRDAQSFAVVEKKIIPQLLEGKSSDDEVRVWVVGCATGEEAYSLAILLLEASAQQASPPRLQIFASDLHDHSLVRAREGVYPGDIETDVSPERLKRFFIKENGGYRIRKEIRELVVFAPHNLLSDPPFSRLDLISCRNLLIYLQRDVQREVIELFHYALLPQKYLILGSSEAPVGNDLFRTEDKNLSIFRKRNVPVPEPRLPVFPPMNMRLGLKRGGAVPSGEHIAYGVLHQKMVERYAPPSVLVSGDDRVVHLSEHAGRYLVHPGGEPTSSVTLLVREELRIELQAALHTARTQGTPVSTKPVMVQFNGEARPVVLHVRTSPEPKLDEYMLVIFEERESSGPDGKPPNASEKASKSRSRSKQAERLREVETELDTTRQRLQALIEEYETSQEEMRASNEEMQSTNEELRSTMEELETSKEELQSMNEELQTVNQENKHKVDELAQLSGDLQNLLAATDIATLFLDRELRILRFTPKVTKLFNVRVTDRSRPISDFTHHLGYDELHNDATQVLENLVPIEREVVDSAGRWYLTRVLPYRSSDDRIAGVVITFVDITQRKRAEDNVIQLKESLEQQVELRTRTLHILQNVTRIANEARSFRKAAYATLARIVQYDGWQVGHLWKLADDNSGCFVSSGVWYVTDQARQAVGDLPEFRKISEATRFAPGERLIGEVAKSNQAIWVDDILALPEWRRGDPEKLGLRSVIAFPVTIRSQVVAVLEFFSDHPAKREKHFMEIMPDVGIQLGHVLERNRMEKMIADTAEREQRRIGQDIHDGIGQELTGLRFLAQTHAESLAKEGSAEAAVAERVAQGFETIQGQLRRIARQLIPVVIDEEGLVSALKVLAARTNEHYPIRCAFDSENKVSVEDNLLATHIYRIAQEAVSNAIRHSKGTQITIHLAQNQGQLHLQVIDDGVGFMPDTPTSEGMGVRSMLYRAELIGGQLRIENNETGGTLVDCVVPLPPSH